MNFLQKGLAGLESRLDKVLLDDPADVPAEQKHAPRQEPRRSASPAAAPRASSDGARMSMQERLAAAVAKAGTRSASPVLAARRADGASPRVSLSESRASGEGVRRAEETSVKETPAKETPAKEKETPLSKDTPPNDTPENAETAKDTPAADTAPADPAPKPAQETQKPTYEDLEALVARLTEDLTLCETRRAEESAAASERIDALESKLQLLAAAAVQDAEGRRKQPEQRELAARDEKIALLIQEGEGLAKNERKLRDTIKKLQGRVREEERAGADAKKRVERLERELETVRAKLRDAWAGEKSARDAEKRLGKVERELERVKREREEAGERERGLREELERERRRAEEAEGRAQTEALEKERAVAAELRERVEALKREAEETQEGLREELESVRAKMAREQEKAKARETELKREQTAMEAQLEVLRARVEEASTAASGDTQAKLLRQIETLQTQYAVASENWRGIESSLLARVASLERERDDASKKESDVRRKAREMSTRTRDLEADLDAANSKVKDLESLLSTHTETLDHLRAKAKAAEAAVQAEKTKAQADRVQLERDYQARIDELERSKTELLSRTSSTTNLAGATHTPSPRPLSPSVGPYARPGRGSVPGSVTESYFLGGARPRRRSPSIDPSEPRSFRSPPCARNDSFTSLPMHTPLDAPADFFDGLPPASPSRHPDLISVSTVAAGPSVQLVERMSATVRRLESEMAGSREELARLKAERDEARAEIVELMKEGEGRRGLEERLREMEKEKREMERRLEASLELIGERSERVEELEQDVADLKGMYRELVSTMASKG